VKAPSESFILNSEYRCRDNRPGTSGQLELLEAYMNTFHLWCRRPGTSRLSMPAEMSVSVSVTLPNPQLGQMSVSLGVSVTLPNPQLGQMSVSLGVSVTLPNLSPQLWHTTPCVDVGPKVINMLQVCMQVCMVYVQIC
jgi:hypothetical protein